MQEQYNPDVEQLYHRVDELNKELEVLTEQYNKAVSRHKVTAPVAWNPITRIGRMVSGQQSDIERSWGTSKQLISELESRRATLDREYQNLINQIESADPLNPQNQVTELPVETPAGSPNYLSALSQLDTGASPSTALSTPAEDVFGIGELDEVFEPEWKPPVGMHTLSVDQIRGILTGVSISEEGETSETGLSDEDIRALLIEEGYKDEEIQQMMEQMQAAIADPVAAWQQREAEYEAWRSGVAEATKPIPWTTWAKIATLQTMSGFGEAFEPYMEHWVRPITGFAVGGIGSLLPGESQWEKEYWQRRESGTADWWHASGEAWEEWDINWVGKLAAEIVFDPVTYVGFGVTSPTKGLTTAAAKSGGRVGVYSNLLSRVSPKLGVGLNALEMGFISTVEKPFIFLKEKWSELPKTSSQIARIAGHHVTQQAISYIDDVAKLLRKPRVLMSAEEVSAALIRAIDIAVANPTAGKAAQVGRELINAHTSFFTADELAKLAAAVGVDIADFTPRELSVASGMLGLLQGSNKNSVISYKEAATHLAGVISRGQKALTNDEIKILEDFIRLRVKDASDIAKLSVQAAKGAPAKSIFKNLYTRVYTTSMAKATSPVFLHEYRMGKLGGFIRSMEQGRLKYFNSFRMGLDSYLTMPFARSYLIFANYGPFNYLETWFKCGFGGAGWQFRVGANEIAKSQMLHGGLLHLPHDIRTFTPRIGFREIWRKTAEQVRLEIMASQEGKRHFIDRWILNPKILTKPLIETFSEMGMQFQAHFINVKQLINTRIKAPKIAAGIDEIIYGKNGVGGVPTPEGLSPKQIKELQELCAEYGLSDAELLDQIPGLLTANNIALADLAEEFMPFGLIEENYKELIYQFHRTGELYSNTDEVFKMLSEMQTYQLLRSPEFWGSKFEEIAESFLKQGLDNPEAFIKGLQSVEVLTDFYSEVARILKREATLYGRTMPDPIQKAAYHAEVDKLLEDFLGGADDSLNRISRALEQNIRHSGLTVAQQDEVLRLAAYSHQYRYQIKSIIAERNAVRQTLVSTTPPGSRDDSWWQNFYKLSDEPWDKKADFIFRLDADRHSSAAVISSAAFKPLKDASSGLSIAHLAELWGVNPEGLHKGLFDLTMGVMIPRDMFVGWQYQRAQKIAVHFGASPDEVDNLIRSLGYTEENIGRVYDDMCARLKIDYTSEISPLAPRLMQLEAMRDIVHRIGRTKGFKPGTTKAIKEYITDVKLRIQSLDGYLDGSGNLHPDFIAAKEEAMAMTRSEYSRVFADYMVEDQNFVDDFIRSIFPYFPYQFHRPQWLLENSLKYPGIPATLGKYENYTDRGYIHIPGTSIEFNPFRGTIFSNVVTRLTMRDLPEYTDAFPNMAQGLDILSRAGFYPGFPIQLGMTVFGAGDPNRRPQWGQLLPATHRSVLNLVTAVCPEEISKPLRELIFPDYFRDYQIVLSVCKRGGNGAEIYRKKLANEPLTEDENSIWEAAAREISAHGLYFEQMAMMRFRPEEMIQAYDTASAVIADRTGITQDVQEHYRKLGLNIWDYFPPLDPETQRILNEMEAIKNWSGVTMPLQPTLIQKEKLLQDEFWGEVEASNELYRLRQVELDSRFLNGGITVDQWMNRTSDNSRDKATSVDTIHNQSRYKGVPLTLEERERWYEEHGEAPPTLHPMKEVLNLWYEIEPTETYNAELGAFVIDWDLYYATQDAILLALPEDLKQEFASYINANKTPLQQLHWEVYREYIRPYNSLKNYAMSKFSPEEQAIIEEWYVTASLDNRRHLESLENAAGNSIINTYRTYKEELGIKLRSIDPTLDAWLFFFGITTTFKTSEAEEIYRSFCTKYGRQLP